MVLLQAYPVARDLVVQIAEWVRISVRSVSVCVSPHWLAPAVCRSYSKHSSYSIKCSRDEQRIPNPTGPQIIRTSAFASDWTPKSKTHIPRVIFRWSQVSRCALSGTFPTWVASVLMCQQGFVSCSGWWSVDGKVHAHAEEMPVKEGYAKCGISTPRLQDKTYTSSIDVIAPPLDARCVRVSIESARLPIEHKSSTGWKLSNHNALLIMLCFAIVSVTYTLFCSVV